MKILIMLSTYNGELYLDKQLQSIFDQDVEASIYLFVRDDGSVDKTLEILHKWEDRLKILYLKDNERLGAAKSFWKLLMNAPEADYYAFVDQDDIWDKNKLAKAISAIGNTEEKVLWFSNCRIISSDGKLIDDSFHKRELSFNISTLMICGCVQGCAMVFNNASFRYIKSLHYSSIPMHDIVIMQYILANGKLVYDPSPYFSYRVHSNNADSKMGKSFIAGIRHSLEKYCGKDGRYAYSQFASDFVNNCENILDDRDKLYLSNLSNCKHSLLSRLYILHSSMTECTNKKALRSFKIRVALGII